MAENSKKTSFIDITGIMKRLLSLFIICIISCTYSGAKDWVDVTSKYIKNPSFDGNSNSGWIYWSNAWGQSTNYGAQEFWKGTVTFYQTIEALPKGKYRIGVQGFYRCGSNSYVYPLWQKGEENLSAQLFAHNDDMSIDDYTPLVSVFSADNTEYMNGCITADYTYFYPNGMSTAAWLFERDFYHNYLEVELDEESTLTLGISNSEYVDDNWLIFDNWTLELWEDVITMSSLTLNYSNITTGKFDDIQLIYNYSPANANKMDIVWSSSDEDVATVDASGLVSTKGKGTTTITCRDLVSGLSATCNITVQSGTPTAQNVIINEIQTRNIDMFVDPSWNYGGWIELYNPTDGAADLGGCIVKDDEGNEKRLTEDFGSIPAHGYKAIWFGHYSIYGKEAYKQVDFRLNPAGGTISIADPEGNILASQTYPATIGRTSYARTTDGENTWGMTSDPTPEKTNATSTWATTQLDAPVVDKDACLFENGFSINVTIPSGSTLRYTTDGSTPTMDNGETSTSGTFDISKTTTLRFRIFKDGYLPSEVVTRSYIYKDRNYDLPTLSITTAPDNLYDDYLGCYVRGVNGRSGNGVTGTAKANWNMDWDRPVNIEVFSPEGNIDFQQEADFAISGGWSRMWSQHYGSPHSFKIKARKEYGINDLPYTWHKEKPHNKYKQILVRNGGNDLYNMSRSKDNILQQILIRSGLYIDAQARQPAHIFINGEFKGTMNIREVTNRQFGYSEYGIDDDSQDAFEMSVDSGYVQSSGTREAFEEWYELAKNADKEENWKRIEELVDIDEFCNYFAAQFYLVNWDWPHNNLKAIRARKDDETGTADGKFHFVIFDLDNCYDQNFNPFEKFQNEEYYTFYPIYNEDGSSYNLRKEVEVVPIFLNMLKNEAFKKKFIDTFCLVAGSVFEPSRCAEIINKISNEMGKYMGWEGHSYYVNNVRNQLLGKLTSTMQKNQIAYMKNYLNVGNELTASISSNIEGAHILMNNISIPTDNFSGSLFGPVTLRAVAPAGYRFAGWKGLSSISTATQETEVFPLQSTWTYYDQGEPENENWKSSQQSTSLGWKEGPGLFGYNLRNGYQEKTTLDYGNDASNKRPTYYFQKSFNLSHAPTENEKYTLTIQFDDGYIVYVNGTEVEAYRLNSGASYSDYASEYGADPFDTRTIIIPNELLKARKNLISVEIHNQSATSSDIAFDASLTLSTSSESEELYPDPTIVLEEGNNYELVAEYQPVENIKDMYADGATPIRINEVSAANSIHINEYFKKKDWIELYNTTDKDIDVAGMYLSDKAKKPQKFQIPATENINTVVPAHGTLVVWCDEAESATQLHAPFKLDNSDGSHISIQAEDGTWADNMTYMEQPRYSTYGRYPDGGNIETLMSQPTINKSNRLGTYDIENNDPETWESTDLSITLELAQGWNWTSHNMENDVDRSRFTGYAQYIKSQTEDLHNDEELGWVGTLKRLSPQSGYKIQMNNAADITLRGQIFNPETEVSVESGWNWIGFPLYNATNINAALENYKATEGDVIIGLDQTATFEDGYWTGTLTSLEPGQAYMMKSAQAQTFTWKSLAQAPQRTKRYAQAMLQAQSPWNLDIHQYPNVMSMIARVEIDGEEVIDNSYSIGAFWGDECRGISELCDGLIYMNIHGDEGEKLNFRLVDREGETFQMEQTPLMQGLGIQGSRKVPYLLSLKTGETGMDTPISLAGNVISTEYYSLSGQRVTHPTSVCIIKTTYQDGRVVTRKIFN